MTDSQGRRARSGHLSSQSQDADNYYSLLGHEDEIFEMDEISLEQRQGAVEIQPQQLMQDVESSMCLPHTYFIKATFIGKFSTMNPAELAENLRGALSEIFNSTTCPVRRAWLITFLRFISSTTLRMSPKNIQ